jgi:hypothetical protein
VESGRDAPSAASIGERGCDTGQPAGGRWLFQQVPVGVDPRVGVEDVVVGGFQDAYRRPAGVDGRRYGGGTGAQLVVRLPLEVVPGQGVEDAGEDQHQEGGRGEGHEREPATQRAECRPVADTAHDRR